MRARNIKKKTIYRTDEIILKSKPLFQKKVPVKGTFLRFISLF